MDEKFVELKAISLLDDNWEVEGKIPKVSRSADVKTLTKGVELTVERPQKDIEDIMEAIREIRIEVAEVALTRIIKSDDIDDKNNDYLVSEVGMNIVLPKGSILELRFEVDLIADGEVVAIDGFPKDVIEEKYIASGKIKLAIDEALQLIPAVDPWTKALKVLKIDLNPWEFKIGRLKRVDVDFSGGLTSRPEWYFKRDGIKNDLRVVLTIRKSKDVKKISGEVTASWKLRHPKLTKDQKIAADTKTIKIF